MMLWTWQTADFDLTTGSVIHGRSEVEAGLPKLRQAQAEVFKRLGTDQIIWCTVRQDGSKWFPVQGQPARHRWQLNVPFQDVIEIIREDVWEKIFDARHADILAGPWPDLFIKDRFTSIDENAIAEHPDAARATALIQHPVLPSRVVVTPAGPVERRDRPEA